MIKHFFILLFSVVVMSSVNAAEVRVGQFSKQNLQGWEEKSFVGNSSYALQQLNDEWVLAASSSQTASAFFYEKEIDLSKTPFLNWRWRIKTRLNDVDETAKEGDDYVARIYVVRDGGIFVWNTIAVNYVWSNQQKQFNLWNNPFAGENVKMFSLQDSKADLNTWYVEKRNLLEDFKKFFADEDVTGIDGVALMIDTDNTKASASGYFGDIYFSEE